MRTPLSRRFCVYGIVRYNRKEVSPPMNEILITVLVGIIIAIVSNVLSHYFAVRRDNQKHEKDCEEQMENRS